MDYRIGKCSACGAEYKIPASFAHDVARCKVCQGTVHIAPAPVAASTPPAAPSAPARPAPSPAAPAAAPRPAEAPRPIETPRAPKTIVPQPARPAAAARPPSPPPAAPAAASAPAEAPKKKGGTLERLKAERQAERDAAQDAAPAAAARPPAAPARSAATPARAPAAAPTARSAPAASARASDGGGRSSGSRRARGAPQPRKKTSKGALIGVVAILGLAGAAYFFRDTLFQGRSSSGNDVEAKEPAETAAATDASGGAEATTPAAPESPAPAAPQGAATPPDGAAPEAVPPQAPAGEDPFAAAAPPAPPAAPDPASIDLNAIPDFGPARDTTPAQWDQMNQWIATWMDPDAGVQGNKAKASLIAQSFRAIPPIVNRLKHIDLSTPEGQENGKQCQAALREICGGYNFNWKEGTTPADVVFNKTVAQKWADLWDKASSDAKYLVKILKLEPGSPEARAIEAIYGVESSDEEPAQEQEPAREDLEDFEVD